MRRRPPRIAGSHHGFPTPFTVQDATSLHRSVEIKGGISIFETKEEKGLRVMKNVGKRTQVATDEEANLYYRVLKSIENKDKSITCYQFLVDGRKELVTIPKRGKVREATNPEKVRWRTRFAF